MDRYWRNPSLCGSRLSGKKFWMHTLRIHDLLTGISLARR
jgi:hypothetical protein